MPRPALKSLLVLFAVSVAMLAGASAAGAVVVNMGGTKVGADLVPGTDASKTGLPLVTGGGTCTDPALTADLVSARRGSAGTAGVCSTRTRRSR